MGKSKIRTDVTMTIKELLEFLKDFPGKLSDPRIKKEK